MVTRQAVSMVVGLGGMIALTRSIGPGNYGQFISFLAMATLAQGVGSFGINVALLRDPASDDRVPYHAALLALTLAGLVATAVIALVVRTHGLPFSLPSGTHWVLVALPLSLATLVPLAKLERNLKFGSVAICELGSQLVYYAVALPYARGVNPQVAPFLGWAAQQLFVAIAAFLLAGSLGGNRLSAQQFRPLLSYGASFSVAHWIWQARVLVNPWIVGSTLGYEAVGITGLAIRITEQLCFARSVAWRISIAALGKIQASPEKMRKAMADAYILQALAVTPPLLAFSLVGGAFIRYGVGENWLSSADLFPFLGLAYAINAVFSLESSALYSLGANAAVARFHAAHVVLFSAATAVLTVQIGVLGIGVAELVAFAAYPLLHSSLTKRIGRVSPLPGVLFAGATGSALFWPAVGVIAWIPLILYLSMRTQRRLVLSLVRDTLASIRHREA